MSAFRGNFDDLSTDPPQIEADANLFYLSADEEKVSMNILYMIVFMIVFHDCVHVDCVHDCV